jgi:hypothetical protein
MYHIALCPCACHPAPRPRVLLISPSSSTHATVISILSSLVSLLTHGVVASPTNLPLPLCLPYPSTTPPSPVGANLPLSRRVPIRLTLHLTPHLQCHVGGRVTTMALYPHLPRFACKVARRVSRGPVPTWTCSGGKNLLLTSTGSGVRSSATTFPHVGVAQI